MRIEPDVLPLKIEADVVLRADQAAARMGAPAERRGARQVAGTFSGRAQAAQLALIEGLAGLVWSKGGTPRVLFRFTVADGMIVAIDMIADPERLRETPLTIPD